MQDPDFRDHAVKPLDFDVAKDIFSYVQTDMNGIGIPYKCPNVNDV